MYKLKFHFASIVALLAMAGCVFFINYPGATGAWVLDDIDNLSKLAGLSDGTVESYLAFLTGGVGGTGRPVSLLTFALQHGSWPVPHDFKIVNYLIHSANFLLVFVLLRNLAKIALPFNKDGSHWAFLLLAAFIAFLWAAAPIQLSTVQYVIQRMALLATFWMLVGINLWIYLLYLSRHQNSRARLLLAVVGVLFFTALATLSKENGILLPLFCVAVFLLIPPAQSYPKSLRVIGMHSVMVPIYLLMAILLIDYQKYFVDAYGTRDFSLLERLYTQFRIIPLYVFKTVYPIGQNFAILWENFPVSRGLLSPVSTLLGLLVLMSLIITGFVFRKRCPLITVGILFFFFGHLLESSILPLELYYEHRNYLPSVGLFIALFGLLTNIPRKVMPMSILGVGVLSVIFSLVSYQEAKVWGGPLNQAVRWYESNPSSERTHNRLAAMLVSYQFYSHASNFLTETADQFPDSVTMPLLWQKLSCNAPEIDAVPEKLLYQRARRADYDQNAVNTLASIMTKLEAGQCPDDTAQKVLSVSKILLKNENYKRAIPDLHVAIGKIYFYAGELQKAKHHIGEALQRTSRLDIVFSAAQIAFAQGNYLYATELYRKLALRCESSLSAKCLELRESIEQLGKQLEMEGDRTG